MIRVLPFLNNLKDLDPSYKTDLDLWDSFGRKKMCHISEEIRYIEHMNIVRNGCYAVDSSGRNRLNFHDRSSEAVSDQ